MVGLFAEDFCGTLECHFEKYFSLFCVVRRGCGVGQSFFDGGAVFVFAFDIEGEFWWVGYGWSANGLIEVEAGVDSAVVSVLFSVGGVVYACLGDAGYFVIAVEDVVWACAGTVGVFVKAGAGIVFFVVVPVHISVCELSVFE